MYLFNPRPSKEYYALNFTLKYYHLHFLPKSLDFDCACHAADGQNCSKIVVICGLDDIKL